MTAAAGAAGTIAIGHTIFGLPAASDVSITIRKLSRE
jgi:hypothetical protein